MKQTPGLLLSWWDLNRWQGHGDRFEKRISFLQNEALVGRPGLGFHAPGEWSGGAAGAQGGAGNAAAAAGLASAQKLLAGV